MGGMAERSAAMSFDGAAHHSFALAPFVEVDRIATGGWSGSTAGLASLAVEFPLRASPFTLRPHGAKWLYTLA